VYIVMFNTQNIEQEKMVFIVGKRKIFFRYRLKD